MLQATPSLCHLFARDAPYGLTVDRETPSTITEEATFNATITISQHLPSPFGRRGSPAQLAFESEHNRRDFGLRQTH